MSKNKREENINKHLSNLQSGVYTNVADSDFSFIPENKPIKLIDIYSLSPAPTEWNIFPPISEMKFFEMILSILENGLFNPIIVWEREEGYMILSGHNRVRAYKYIEEKKLSNKDFSKIEAIVYERAELDELKARAIIVDTNYVQREYSKSLLPQIIKQRVEIVKNDKNKKGKTLDIVAKEMNMGRTTVYEEIVISDKIIPEIADFYYNGKINKKNLLKFANLSKEDQSLLFKNYSDYFNDDYLNIIKKDMKLETIIDIFENYKPIKYTTVTIRVKEDKLREFKEFLKQWKD